MAFLAFQGKIMQDDQNDGTVIDIRKNINHINEDCDDLTRKKSKKDSTVDKAPEKVAPRAKSLSLELNIEVHKALKTIAIEKNETMNSIVIHALRKFIKEEDSLNAQAEERRRRLA